MHSKKDTSNTNILLLSLGSNIGDRLKYINEGIAMLEKGLGNVISKAHIYQTPAWGFNSNLFLNTCIEIKTEFNTKQCLQIIKEIETKIGRKQKTKKEYEDRPIDIDIIYSSEGIFNYTDLIVPHPLLQQRKFVLYPLKDIYPLYKHPLIHKNTIELIKNCNDNSEIHLFSEI